MSTRLQLRRGNTAQTAVFTGAIAEVTVDTDQKTLTVHDGTTVGGNYIISKSQFDANLSIIQGINDTQNTNITGANNLAQSAYDTANTSLQNSGTQTLNGNLIINGSINTTEWSNTSDAYVSNKLYAGIAPFLSTPLPDLIAQFTGNTNNYIQVNAQNIDPEGSADFVITADVGNDENFYINMGLHNSSREFGATYPLDGYLLVQGNTGQVGGNLIIGTLSQTPGQHTKIVAGGGEESNIVIQFNDDLSTIFYGNAIPSVTNTHNLGSSTKQWKNIYIDNSVDIDNVVLSNTNGFLTISGAQDFILDGSGIPSIGVISNKADDAYDTANAANGMAVGAFAQANTNSNAIAIIEGVNLEQNTTITAVNNFAVGAYDTANSKFNSAGGTISGDVNVTGNLSVTGTTFYANTEQLLVKDNIITLNSNVTGSPTLDAGIEVNRGSETNTVLKWSESNHAWQFTNDGINFFKIADTDRVNSAFSLANTNAGNITIIQGVNLGQNTTITEVNQFAQSAFNTANGANGLSAGAYNQANTNAGAITIIQGVDLTQNTEIAGLQGVDLAQNSAISIIQGVDLAQNTTITAVNNFAGSAFNTANGANDLAVGAYNQANTGTNIAEAAFAFANTLSSGSATDNVARTLAQSAFDSSNAVNGYAQTAFATANSAQTNTIFTQGVDATQNIRLSSIETVNIDQNTAISIIQGTDATQNTQIFGIQGVDLAQNSAITIIQGVDVTQNTNIIAVNNYAASAFNKANTGGTFTGNVIVQQNLTVDKNLIVSGDLIVAGNSTSISANNLVINDPLIILANNNTLDAVDIGFIAHYNEFEPGESRHTGVIRHAEDNEYYIFYNYDKHVHSEFGANNIIDVLDPSFLLSNVNGGYFKGNLIATTAVIGGTDVANYISVTQGIDNTQNTRLNAIETINNNQNTSIGIIQGVDLTQNTNITAVNNFAAGAFARANNSVLKAGDTMTGALTGVTTLGATTISLAQVDATSNTFTTASTAQVSIDAWPTATYRSAKYFVQITSGSSYHIIELNLVHNGTTVFLAQYGEVLTGSSLGTFDADISSGTVRVLFTGTNAVSTVKVLRTVVDV
jgi:hypothetical protein